MKYLFRFFVVALLLLGMTVRVAAAPNNIYGIHLAQPHLEDLKAASDLVNSNGGKWGYVTLVIQENDRDKNKWQGIFDLMRELHLIPIVRLATSPVGENWRRPEPEDVKDWVSFLDSLNWVVKDRYIILFNEPNHGSEWGGEVDEKSYSKIAFSFAKALKEKNPDYFVMLAGFDASAPSWPPGLEDEETFIRKMLTDSVSKIFDYIDGWSSHSYPNPAFAGSPWDYGRGTVRTYEWELELLKRLGVNKELSVFITETGWQRQPRRLNEADVAENFRIAFEQVWSGDSRVRAVTAFVLDYQGSPFLEFSWKTPSAKASEGQEFYQQYYTVQSLPKTKGEPEQVEKGEINFDLPKDDFKINLKNQGQGIWDKEENYELRIKNQESSNLNFLVSNLKDIKPFEEKTVDFSLKTVEEKNKEEIKFLLTKDNKVVIESKLWKYTVLPLPDLNIEVNFWPWGKGKGDDFEVQVFDVDDRLVFKKKGVKVENGQGIIKSIQNIAIDELYRVVILHPGHLPRQTYIVFQTKDNLAKFKSMLPFDKNSDGKLDFKDFLKLFSY